jgi:hypothetical protein
MNGDRSALTSVEAAEPFLPLALVVASAVTRIFLDMTLVPNIGASYLMLRNGHTILTAPLVQL